jgi:hypothetical protein
LIVKPRIVSGTVSSGCGLPQSMSRTQGHVRPSSTDSFHRRTMKHVIFAEEWIKEGDSVGVFKGDTKK